MAASSMKDIKNRIKSVENTMQITKAMELVASSKLSRAKERIVTARPYFDFLHQTIAEIKASLQNAPTAFSTARPNDNVCLVVMGGDRGLAGGFNNNVFNLVKSKIDELKADRPDCKISIFPIGRRVAEHFAKRNVTLIHNEYEIAEAMDIADCHDMGRVLCSAFANKEYDSVFVFYTRFVSILTQEPVYEKILPFSIEQKQSEKKQLTIYEPGAESVLHKIVPLYLMGIIYGALSESLASEYGARRTAMDAATKNAGEIVDDLSLKYNRARQAAITQEITEIVSGAEAL